MVIYSLALISTLVTLSQAAPLVHSFVPAVSGSSFWEIRSVRTVKRQSSIAGPAIASDFPDPAIISFDGGYHAFSTNSGGIHVPSARTEMNSRWVLDGADTLPAAGAWAEEKDIWAPDVVELVSHQV
jgi:hypothetical protein